MLLAPSPFQAPLLRELCALCVKIPIPNPCTPSRNCRPLSLFPATQREVLPCRPFVRRSYQNTVSAAPSPKILTALFSFHKATKPLRIRTYEKRARKSFTIRTSKTQDLKSFRIRTYKKTPGGRGPKTVLFPLPQKQIRNIQVILLCVPFWERTGGNGGETRVKTLGR